jgi:hypothetical protein
MARHVARTFFAFAYGIPTLPRSRSRRLWTLDSVARGRRKSCFMNTVRATCPVARAARRCRLRYWLRLDCALPDLKYMGVPQFCAPTTKRCSPCRARKLTLAGTTINQRPEDRKPTLAWHKKCDIPVLAQPYRTLKLGGPSQTEITCKFLSPPSPARSSITMQFQL